MMDVVTPRASDRHNPFDVHPLLTPTRQPQPSPFIPQQDPGLTALQSPIRANFPTTSLSLNPPVFNMSRPPIPRQNSTVAPSGQIHIKLISASGLNVSSPSAKPYVVVQFEKNDFVGSDPCPSQPNSRPQSMAGPALEALGAIARSANSRKSSTSSSNGIPTGLFSSVPHSPVWKSEVSFDVTSSQSMITFTVYDRSSPDHGFLGQVEIKPVLLHDHTVDGWHKLLPISNEPVTGEIRVQITYDQPVTKSPLTPASFEFLKLIGRGTFGKVFQVRKRDTHRIYAMKVLSKKEIVLKKEVAHTIGERKILHLSLSCPFLVGLKFSFQTEQELFLVTDFKSGGELFWHLQKETRFGEERSRFYVAELILALEHLHAHGIIYRDLKPENILLDATGHIALCDFGLSKLFPNLPSPSLPSSNPSLTSTFCGTTEYLAPEILLSEHGYGREVDFWSLGVLLFEMCCGWSPFYAEDTQQMYKNICFGKIRFPKGVICEDGKSFVKGLLNRNPRHRLGALRDTAELKEHPFFKEIDWDLLAKKQVNPPFKPVVESDESTNNFDPEFTGADLKEFESLVGVVDDFDSTTADETGDADGEGEWLDEDDTSESWVEQNLAIENGGTAGSLVREPLGPLGSDRPPSSASGNLSKSNSTRRALNGTTKSKSSGEKKASNGKTPRPSSSSRSNNSGAIDISKRPAPNNRVPGGANSVLTNSVQEKFKGFTFSGGESVVAGMGEVARRAEEKERLQRGDEVGNKSRKKRSSDSDTGGDTTDSEFEDFRKSAGRYANTRRKGLGFTELDDDI